MTQPQGADYRQRLINALAVTISREGYGGAKIQDLVREAKVSLRTFYAEFPNKEECFLALNEQITAAILELVRSSVTFEESWREEMRKGFVAYFQALEAAPRLTYAVVIELATLSDRARGARQAGLAQLYDVVLEQIEEGRRRYPDVPSRSISLRMVQALMGGVIEMMVDLVVRDEIHRLTELSDVATDLMWSVVTNVTDPATLGSGGPVEPAKSGVEAPPASTDDGVRR